MASKDNDDNMDEDRRNNKRKINTVSPSKDDQGASNAPDEEILSISSKDSKMTTASSNNKEATMGNVLADNVDVSSPPINGSKG